MTDHEIKIYLFIKHENTHKILYSTDSLCNVIGGSLRIYIICQLTKCDAAWNRSFTALLLKYSLSWDRGGGAQLVFIAAL